LIVFSIEEVNANLVKSISLGVIELLNRRPLLILPVSTFGVMTSSLQAGNSAVF